MGVKDRHWAWHAKPLHILLVMVILSACSVAAPPPRKIALLAPFEGQYRDIGYEAFYAAQMSLDEALTGPGIDGNGILHPSSYMILPLDDGGTEASAQERAHALTYDPSIVFVLALGPYATAPSVQEAYGKLPVLLVGYWPSVPQSDNIAALTADFRDVLPAISDPYTTQDEPLVSGELLSLTQFDTVADEDCTIWTSTVLPSDDFRLRYEKTNTFAPPPRLISNITSGAVFVAVRALQTGVPMRDFVHNGERFFNEAGYVANTQRNEFDCAAVR